MCNADKFVISQTFDNEFTLTIKQQGSTLPMVLTDTDTFIAKLYKLDDNSVVNINITTTLLTPYNNGKITLHISAVDAMTHLEYDRGSKADRYYLKPMYRLAIDCNTTNNGNFIARIDTVYVDK